MTWLMKAGMSLPRVKGTKRQKTYKEGAAKGNAKAAMLLGTIMAAMALAAYFWYVSMM